jgi:hypothetical protein
MDFKILSASASILSVAMAGMVQKLSKTATPAITDSPPTGDLSVWFCHRTQAIARVHDDNPFRTVHLFGFGFIAMPFFFRIHQLSHGCGPIAVIMQGFNISLGPLVLG